MKLLDEIKNKLESNEIEEAIVMLDKYIADNGDCEEAYFLRGNAYRRKNDWKNAISDYCKARELNPKGAGAQAYDAAIDIMAFYNTDLYNP